MSPRRITAIGVVSGAVLVALLSLAIRLTYRTIDRIALNPKEFYPL